jgi:hypothetical protein
MEETHMRINLQVPFKEKDQARKLGARWVLGERFGL